jgi:hypothetical protein
MKRGKKWAMAMVATMLIGWYGSTALANEVNVTWDPTIDATHYTLYFSNTSGVYIAVDSKDTNTINITIDLPNGKWYLVATAKDDYGNESVYSNELEVIIRTLQPPQSLRLTRKEK